MIRLLGPSDVNIFRSIRLEALRAEPAAYSSTAAKWEALTDNEWRRRMTGSPVMAAFLDDEAVGIMGLLLQRSDKMAHRATIVMVYVRSSSRGTGLASALLKHLTDHARGIGVRRLELAVSVENEAAIRFYRREGFVEIGRIPGGLLHEGREIDELLMAWDMAA